MKEKETIAPTPTHHSPPTLTIQFKVWAPDFNRVGHRLFLLGSLPEMGAWNINNAVEAFPTSDLHIWKAEVRGIAAKSLFEWVWLKTKTDRSNIQWERAVKRNRTLGIYSGIIHSVFGEGQEVFQQAVTTVDVTTFIKVEDNNVLVLTGDSITTGAWDLAHAVKAKEYPMGSGYWKAQVTFDAFSSLTFKWAVVREKDGKLQVIEKHSHDLYGRAAWVHAVAPWNLAQVFVVDTSVAMDTLDNLEGRTDLLVNDRKQRFDEIRTWHNKSNVGKTPSLLPLSQVPTPKANKSNANSKTPAAATTTVPGTTTTTTNSKAMTTPPFYQQMSDKMAIPITSPSTQSQGSSKGHKPTVQPVSNLDEHSKRRQGQLEKLSKKYNEEFKDAASVSQIKGTGQITQAKQSGKARGMWLEFPWSFGNATQDEVMCLVETSMPKSSGKVSNPSTSIVNTTVATAAVVKFAPMATQTEDQTKPLSAGGAVQKSKLVGASGTTTKKKKRKDELRPTCEDEDSGIDSFPLPAYVPCEQVESACSLIDSVDLNYDLVAADGISEMMSQSKGIPDFHADTLTFACKSAGDGKMVGAGCGGPKVTDRDRKIGAEAKSKSKAESAKLAAKKLKGVFGNVVLSDGPATVYKASKNRTVDICLESEPALKDMDMVKENLYLEWLSGKVEREERYRQNLMKACISITISEKSLPSSTVGKKREAQCVIKRRTNTTTIAKRAGSDAKTNRTLTWVIDEESSTLAPDETPAPPWVSKLSVNDVTHDGVDPESLRRIAEHPEVVHRREMARVLEEEWGSGAFKISPSDTLLGTLPLTSPIVAASTNFLAAYQIDGSGELIRQPKEGRRWERGGTGVAHKMADYTNTDLINAVICHPPSVDRRAVAQMLEERWGKMAVTL